MERNLVRKRSTFLVLRWAMGGVIGVGFQAASRPALGPTRLPIQWLPGALCPWGVKLTTHLNLEPKSGIVNLYLHSRILLSGVIIN
jgi:hypothetical protein